MLSVAVTPDEDTMFEELWCMAIPTTGGNYDGVTRERLWYWAQQIYARYPALLAAAKADLRM